jgi:hypothetical protein
MQDPVKTKNGLGFGLDDVLGLAHVIERTIPQGTPRGLIANALGFALASQIIEHSETPDEARCMMASFAGCLIMNVDNMLPDRPARAEPQSGQPLPH